MKRIAGTILSVECGCGAISAANLRSHSAEGLRQTDQGKMGPMYDGGLRCDRQAVFSKGWAEGSSFQV